MTADIANRGLQDLTGVMAGFRVIYTDQQGVRDTIDSETVQLQETIASGDTKHYTFAETFSALKAGTYVVKVTVRHDADTDKLNNSYTAPALTVHGELSVPVKIGFETSENTTTIQMTPSTSWGIGQNNPYEGARALAHQGAAQTDGDLCVLPLMHLDTGQYELSYFWKTMTGNTGDAYKQSWQVYLSPTPEVTSESQLLSELTDTLNADHKHTKELVPFTVANAGSYYLLVKVNTLASSGSLRMDNFEVKAPVTGLDIMKESYDAAFSQGQNTWYNYHPASPNRPWAVADTNDGVTTDTYVGESTGVIYTAGLLESPAFALKGGESYTITYAATATGTAAAINLLVSDQDKPEAFQLLADSRDGILKDTLTFQAERDGNYWFAFSTESTAAATFKVTDFTLSWVNTGVAINEQNFPDERFRLLVSRTFDANTDDYLSADEIAAAKVLNINSQNVVSCQGIEYLTELEQFVAYYNSIAELDLSKNTKLTQLGLFSNQLTKLDLSNNPLLTNVNASFNNLGEINLAGCQQITNLQLVGNYLTRLDVSGLTELTTLTVAGNALVTLDLSHNTKLTTFTQQYTGVNSEGQQVTLKLEVNVPTADGTVDMSQYTTDNFSATTVTNLTGATLSGSMLTFTATDATYQYQTGNATFPVVDVTLHRTAPDGISLTTVSDAAPAAYYDVQGRRSSAQQRGLNIVRMQDGTVRKVVVK